MGEQSTASTVWEGDLAGGRGTFHTGSGTIGPLEVTWAARTKRVQGTTSPEELLAAAHACCFSMALAHELAQAGNAPDRLEVEASVGFGPVEGGFGVTGSVLTVRGTVPGLDVSGFEQAAQAAGEGCPISKALAIPVEVHATLA